MYGYEAYHWWGKSLLTIPISDNCVLSLCPTLQPHHPSIENRLNLRKNLHCQTFKWYLENVYPELRYTYLLEPKLATRGLVLAGLVWERHDLWPTGGGFLSLWKTEQTNQSCLSLKPEGELCCT